MAEYPDSIKIYIYVSSAWLDITSDILAADKISGFWGMASNRELDRVARPGSMSFSLDNSTGKYSPNLSTATAGWGKGTKVKLNITYRGRTRTRFYGAVDNLKISGGALGLRKVQVTVKDWMDYAVKYPLVSPGYATNKRADEAITTILAGMPIQPQSSTLGTGEETFPTVFDAVTTKTTAQSEFFKLAMSEMGYIYHRKDGLYGDNLRFDARTYRKGTDTPTTYSVPSADSGFLLKEDGGYLLTESGDKIIIERAENLTLDVDNNMQDINVTYGDNIINRMSVIAYPRRIDTSNAVLFSLGYAMEIAAGQTIEFRGNYFDPSGGAVVNAVTSSMVSPAATTDYLMNDADDGSGTDRTASLTVTATYGTEGVTYILENTHGDNCYITKLQARGIGVYTYAQIESVAEDQPSIDEYGYSSEQLHQEYQQTTTLGKNQAAKILDVERLPRTKLNTVSLNSSKSPDLMYGFIVYDIGDLVHVVEDVSGVDSNFYIQAVSFVISAASVGGLQTGIIDYSWTLKQSMSLSSTGNDYSGLSLVAADFGATLGAKGINFNVIDEINKLTTKTISVWVYFSSTSDGVIFSNSNESSSVSGGWAVQVGTVPGYISFKEYSTREWIAGAVSTNAWTHYLITKNSTSLNTAPVIYKNGVIESLTTTGTQSVIPSQIGNLLTLGAKRLGSDVFSYMKGKVEDARVYSDIKTAAEALAIYNEGPGGTGYLNNCIFQAPVVKTQELDYFTDHAMLSTDRVLDNVYGYAGAPAKEVGGNYPIIRLP